MNEGLGGSQISQIQYNAAPPQKQADIYDIHRQCVMDYHDACKGFARAEAMRAQAKAAMDKASEELAKTIQANMQDPTVPQQLPMNGSAGAQLRQF